LASYVNLGLQSQASQPNLGLKILEFRWLAWESLDPDPPLGSLRQVDDLPRAGRQQLEASLVLKPTQKAIRHAVGRKLDS